MPPDHLSNIRKLWWVMRNRTPDAVPTWRGVRCKVTKVLADLHWARMGKKMQKSKEWIRKGVEAAAQVVVLPSWLAYRLHVRLFGAAGACSAISQRAGQWPGLSGLYRRRALYKKMIARMGENVAIGLGTVLTKPTIELGHAVYVGNYCIVGDVRIGDNTLISDHVSIISGNHSMEPGALIKDQPEVYRTITIGEDCWVGSRAVILADIGDHAVVGAGSVVTKPVPAYTIVAGNPARPIGDRRQRTAKPSSIPMPSVPGVMNGRPLVTAQSMLRHSPALIGEGKGDD